MLSCTEQRRGTFAWKILNKFSNIIWCVCNIIDLWTVSRNTRSICPGGWWTRCDSNFNLFRNTTSYICNNSIIVIDNYSCASKITKNHFSLARFAKFAVIIIIALWENCTLNIPITQLPAHAEVLKLWINMSKRLCEIIYGHFSFPAISKTRCNFILSSELPFETYWQ